MRRLSRQRTTLKAVETDESVNEIKLSKKHRNLLQIRDIFKAVGEKVKFITSLSHIQIPEVVSKTMAENTERAIQKTRTPDDAGAQWNLTLICHETSKDYGSEAVNKADFWDISDMPDPAKSGKQTN